MELLRDAPRSTSRVLLVEDDAFSLKLMRDVLMARGYRIAEATNGRDGLELAVSVAPDLIVMDVGLPGMDGVEVTRRLKSDEATARIPVLAVTAYAMPGDEDRMRAAGCDEFLTKPLSFAQFVTIVDFLCGGSVSRPFDQSSASGREK